MREPLPKHQEKLLAAMAEVLAAAQDMARAATRSGRTSKVMAEALKEMLEYMEGDDV